ncbi:hypothetical protein D8B26_001429 [Coccidioides posadasii str. Silveira]|uniref:Predicted protein n=3 Tax=Coccidioides posadasii TaxID=199306 RepID=E9DAF1_COCPS|nr:hypothetical protein CPC735_047030 [Coccidioides posadasii C735 delta SOWgp]EER23333.1 hypothetical protein CPC735_047030 [Coccidioides posadasii C735 delta SOWgp]EFW16573.1 predicted protein [Coccidioides posadasii str. Silveira]KMM64664.1 hypothetical protein CPAG_01016 [Coccidioides posadasii RMSCC 3488]QVM06722.1 hypothetical protein D8B26_001429 [Coccidioides posadasii str. Silveira]|eukprot:XP_003065478.1 hypothetical protein CPC735_047030 [Coccidioides posadasii C735 delta SOWgp]
MKLSVPLILAAFSPLVAARGCKAGYYYCGFVLLEIGNYERQIEQALETVGVASPSAYQITDTLFFCPGGARGDDITYVKTCEQRCSSAGTGESDFCVEFE